MQYVTFSNGKAIKAEEIRGGSYKDRETLAFTIPEGYATFDELKDIFLDKEATKEITVEYEDEKGYTQKNLQIGYIVPVSLSYAGDKFSMTLGKQTQAEAEYADLRADVDEIMKAIGLKK
jgi:hypothetical protein